MLLNKHHGSRKYHSTTTVLSLIHHHLDSNYYNNKLSAIIETDLSAAFDTVKHGILLQKLEHYGIINKENFIFKSILENRFQYIEVEWCKSNCLN